VSRLIIPVRYQTLWNTGDVLLRVVINLRLKTAQGGWRMARFRVDTATDITTFPAYDAKRLGLPLPQKASPGATHTQTGLPIRSGILRFQVEGLDATEYAIACFFLGDPDTPADPRQPATLPQNLLQPFQLVGRLRFALQQDPALGNLYGELVVETV
jgi:hypothetical protein